MNPENLMTFGDKQILGAVEDKRRLLELLNDQFQVESWLRQRGLPSTSSAVRPRDSIFDLIYTFGNDLLIPFARMEGEFWMYADTLMSFENESISAFLYSESPTPLASVELANNSWNLVLTPHPDMLLEKYPDHEFWLAASAYADECRDDQQRELRWDREREVALALRADSPAAPQVGTVS